MEKKREAKSLLGFKKTMEYKSDQEKKQKVTVLSYPLKKINFPKTNTRDIKDQHL